MLLGASWGEQVKKEEGALEVEEVPRGEKKNKKTHIELTLHN